jgi:hypothetical protein
MLSRDQSRPQREVRERRQQQPILRNYAPNARKKGSTIGCPRLFVKVRDAYFGACTTIRVALMVKVPLMLRMGLPSRS